MQVPQERQSPVIIWLNDGRRPMCLPMRAGATFCPKRWTKMWAPLLAADSRPERRVNDEHHQSSRLGAHFGPPAPAAPLGQTVYNPRR